MQKCPSFLMAWTLCWISSWELAWCKFLVLESHRQTHKIINIIYISDEMQKLSVIKHEIFGRHFIGEQWSLYYKHISRNFSSLECFDCFFRLTVLKVSSLLWQTVHISHILFGCWKNMWNNFFKVSQACIIIK